MGISGNISTATDGLQRHAVYDAWNRMTACKEDNSGSPGTTIATYSYDGLRRRVRKSVTADSVTHDNYYSAAWQMLEVRKNSDPDPLDQYVWGMRYIDAVVIRFHDANTDGDYADAGDSTLYYMNDANMNVTALADTSAAVQERYHYDAYGKPTFLTANWTVRATQSSPSGNPILYAGYHYDQETGLYNVRHRTYHPTLGRWTQTDPLDYVDGMNVYEYCGSGPTDAVDYLGLMHTIDEWIGGGGGGGGVGGIYVPIGTVTSTIGSGSGRSTPEPGGPSGSGSIKDRLLGWALSQVPWPPSAAVEIKIPLVEKKIYPGSPFSITGGVGGKIRFEPCCQMKDGEKTGKVGMMLSLTGIAELKARYGVEVDLWQEKTVEKPKKKLGDYPRRRKGMPNATKRELTEAKRQHKQLKKQWESYRSLENRKKQLRNYFKKNASVLAKKAGETPCSDGELVFEGKLSGKVLVGAVALLEGTVDFVHLHVASDDIRFDYGFKNPELKARFAAKAAAYVEASGKIELTWKDTLLYFD